MAVFNQYEKQESGRQVKFLSDDPIRIMGNVFGDQSKFLIEMSKSEALELKDQVAMSWHGLRWYFKENI